MVTGSLVGWTHSLKREMCRGAKSWATGSGRPGAGRGQPLPAGCLDLRAGELDCSACMHACPVAHMRRARAVLLLNVLSLPAGVSPNSMGWVRGAYGRW
jgi:hypothetical protein